MESTLWEKRAKFIFKLLAIAGVVCFSLLLVPQIRSLLLEFGEKLLGRPLNSPQAWNSRLLFLSFLGIILCIGLFIFSVFFNAFIK